MMHSKLRGFQLHIKKEKKEEKKRKTRDFICVSGDIALFALLPLELVLRSSRCLDAKRCLLGSITPAQNTNWLGASMTLRIVSRI